jgi:hypothetical protein
VLPHSNEFPAAVNISCEQCSRARLPFPLQVEETNFEEPTQSVEIKHIPSVITVIVYPFHSFRNFKKYILIGTFPCLQQLWNKTSRWWPGFDPCSMQLSDYNFTSVTCEKSASSLTLPNNASFLHVLWFPPVITHGPIALSVTIERLLSISGHFSTRGS